MTAALSTAIARRVSRRSYSSRGRRTAVGSQRSRFSSFVGSSFPSGALGERDHRPSERALLDGFDPARRSARKLSDIFPESVNGEYAPLATPPWSGPPGVSPSTMLSVPDAVEGFAFGVHLNADAPAAVSPAPFSTAHDTAPAVFRVAVYFTAANDSPLHPESAPFTFTVCAAATLVRPGERVIVPVFVMHSAFTTGT